MANLASGLVTESEFCGPVILRVNQTIENLFSWCLEDGNDRRLAHDSVREGGQSKFVYGSIINKA